MEWLLIIALGVWVLRLSQRVGQLEQHDRTSPSTSASPKRAVEPEQSSPSSTPAAAPTPPRNPNVERWLSENGLAWLGGGALALGGIFLVAYAAQRGFFTPIMRLIAALLVGGFLIAASEWLRRSGAKVGLQHPLVAALLAGAGAATLYGSVWGAYGLYHYIDWGVAALALSAIVVLLLGLALLHGEAIGVLAIGAAYLAPLLASSGKWPWAALSLFVITVVFTGYALAALRRWAWVAGAALLGSYLWFALSFSEGETIRGIVLLGVAALGACGLSLVPTRTGEAEAGAWPQARQVLPTSGILVSSLLGVIYWVRHDVGAAMAIMPPAILDIFLIALAAVATRRGVTPSSVFAAAVASAAFGFTVFGASSHTPGDTHYVTWVLAVAGVAALSGLGAGLPRQAPPTSGISRVLAHGAGALGALCLVLLATFAQAHWRDTIVWLMLSSSGALMLLAAMLCARFADDARNDAATDIWAAAGGALLFLALESAISSDLQPLAFAAAALVFAALHAWRGWRALSAAALVGGALTLAHALAPSFTGAAFAGEAPLWLALGVLLGAAASLFAGSLVLRRAQAPRSPTISALPRPRFPLWRRSQPYGCWAFTTTHGGALRMRVKRRRGAMALPFSCTERPHRSCLVWR